MPHKLTKPASLLVACMLAMGWLPFAESAEPVSVLAAGEVSNPRQPQAAVGEDGSIYVAFAAGNAVYCAASMDGGKSYSDPVRVGEVDRLALGMRRGPRIAAGPDVLVVTAVSHEGGNVLAWRSSDRGRTWDGPVNVNDNSPGTANEGLHALAVAQNGDLYCVWLDHRIDRENQIFGAASTDGGKTWGENRLIYRSPSGSVCQCCHPAVTFDSRGTLYVMWRNSLEGYRDMYAAVSRDGGQTFSDASKLGAGSWELNTCPMDGGYLAATGPGQVTTVWRRRNEIFRSERGRRGEQLLGRGEQPWIAATPEGSWIVWLTKRGDDLWLAAPETTEPVKLADAAVDPVIAASPAGEGPVVVVWEAGAQADATIIARVVSD